MHSTLRILFVFALATWSLVCCCQASVLLNAACSGQTPRLTDIKQPSATDSCCRGCVQGQAADNLSAPAPERDDVPSSESCASCAQCLGLAEACRSTAAPKTILSIAPPLHTIQLACLSLCSRVLCVWPHLAFDTQRLYTASSFMRSNRDAQRWHCALLL